MARACVKTDAQRVWRCVGVLRYLRVAGVLDGQRELESVSQPSRPPSYRHPQTLFLSQRPAALFRPGNFVPSRCQDGRLVSSALGLRRQSPSVGLSPSTASKSVFALAKGRCVAALTVRLERRKKKKIFTFFSPLFFLFFPFAFPFFLFLSFFFFSFLFLILFLSFSISMAFACKSTKVTSTSLGKLYVIRMSMLMLLMNSSGQRCFWLATRRMR